MTNLSLLSIRQAHELLITKRVSCVDLVKYYLDRIEKHEPQIKAVITLCGDDANVQAKKIDDKIAAGEEIGLLEGIPYTAKDMFSTKGVQTTAASQILKGYIPPYSATVINSLNEAGAILLAKTNQDEFAHGGSTENSSFAKTTNPWNINRVPGGSSGGSAAAVAADYCVFSLGTDTGGSIREPAAFCGVTGLKPTYGRVSRYGVIAMASSFDCIGPITRSADDAQIVLDVISGQDPMDATTLSTLNASEDHSAVNSMRIGIPKDYIKQTTVKELTNTLDIEASEIEMVDSVLALSAYYVLVPSEISSNLERYDGIRYGQVNKVAKNTSELYSKTRAEFLGDEVKRRILIGTYALSSGYYDAYYKKAMQVRQLVCEQFDKIFKDCDLIVMPTTFQPAFEFGAKSDPLEMYKTDLLTVTANLAGLPAISIPAGIDSETNMPLGIQIIGQQKADKKVLALASEFQSKTSWHLKLEEIKL